MENQKLIYIYPKKSTFINADISFLKKKYQVIFQDLKWFSVAQLPFNLIRQLFFLTNNTKSSKAILISFAGYFSVLPVFIGKLFKKPVFIILNGTESVSFPSYNYGSLRKSILKKCIKYSLKNATKLFPVDDSLVKQIHTFDDEVKQKKQGFQNHFPEIKTPFSVIPNGFDTQFWKAETVSKNGFISVAFIDNHNTFTFKGIDLFIEMANHFPNEQFTVIGISDAFKKELKSIPKNVTILSSADKNELKKQCSKHQFYVQLSINEGFGCALAEAMLCECIPIVSNVGALPNVIGKNGFIVQKRNTEDILAIFKKSISLSESDKKDSQIKSREKICKDFDISIREKLILQELEI